MVNLSAGGSVIGSRSHWAQTSIQCPRWFNVISLKWRGNNVDSTSVCPVGCVSYFPKGNYGLSSWGWQEMAGFWRINKLWLCWGLAPHWPIRMCSTCSKSRAWDYKVLFAFWSKLNYWHSLVLFNVLYLYSTLNTPNHVVNFKRIQETSRTPFKPLRDQNFNYLRIIFFHIEPFSPKLSICLMRHEWRRRFSFHISAFVSTFLLLDYLWPF